MSMRQRLSGILWPLITITVLVTVLGLIYYLQISSKERYFDQLYFRNLDEISRSFESNLGRFENYAKTTKSIIDLKTDRSETRPELTNEQRKSLFNRVQRLKPSSDLKPELVLLETGHVDGNLDQNTISLSPITRARSYNDGTYELKWRLSDSILLRTTLEQLLPKLSAATSEFDLLLVTSPEGAVYAKQTLLQDLRGHEFISIGKILSRTETKPGDDVGDGGQSSDTNPSERTYYKDIFIGGISYRAYVYPNQLIYDKLRINNDADTNPTMYFVGIKRLSDIRIQNLKISPNAASSLLMLTLSIVILMGFLKLQLVQGNSAFTGADFSVMFLFLSLIPVVTIVAGQSYFLSGETKKEYDEIADSTFNQIRTNFRKELETNLRSVENLMLDSSTKSFIATGIWHKSYDYGPIRCRDVSQQESANVLSPGPQPQCSGIEDKTSVKDLDMGFYFAGDLTENLRHEFLPIENVFTLNQDGDITGVMLRGTEQLANRFNQNLASRLYFQNTMSGRLWDVETMNKKPYSQSYKLFIERIFNKSDGERTTQLALPSEKGGNFDFEEVESSVSVISFGTTFRSLKSLLLWPGFNFAVFDNVSGKVLYHQDDTRSLVENFIAETDNSAQLHSLINLDEHMDAISFAGQYRGVPTQFYAGRIHPDIPWTLVVYVAQEGLEARNMLNMVTALLVAMSLALFSFGLFNLICYLLPGKSNFLWPQPDLESRYLDLAKIFVQLIPASYFAFNLGENYLALVGILSLILIAVISIFYIALGKRPFRTIFYPYVKPIAWACIVTILLLAGLSLGLHYKNDSLSLAVVLISIAATAFAIYNLNKILNQPEFKENLSSVNSSSVNLSQANASHVNMVSSLGSHLQTFRFAYVALLASALFLVIGIATVVSYQKIGSELYSKLALVDFAEVQQRRSLFDSRNENYLARLCGATNPEAEGARCSTVANSTRNRNTLTSPLSLLEARQCRSEPVPDILCMKRVAASTQDSGASLLGDLLELFKVELELPITLRTTGYIRGGSEDSSTPNLLALASGNYRFPTQVQQFISQPVLFVFVLLAGLIIFVLAVDHVARKLLGVQVPSSFRNRKVSLTNQNWSTFKQQQLMPNLNDPVHDYGTLVENMRENKNCMLIRPLKDNLRVLFRDAESKKLKIEIMLDALLLSEDEEKIQSLLTKKPSDGCYEVIQNLEGIVYSKPARERILSLLETLRERHVPVLIVAEVSPLFMLTQQQCYDDTLEESQYADTHEVARWSALLSHFTKHYDWNPIDLDFGANIRSDSTVLRECSAWPELYPLLDQFERHCSQNKLKISELNEDQIIQFFSTNAGAYYRRRWHLCTREERLLLHQIATGHLINPANLEPLEHLSRRGYIRRTPKWAIVNHSFRRFVLSAEPSEVFARWVEKSEDSLWKVIRFPLIAVVFVLVAILTYSASEALDSFLGLAASMLALIPLILRNIAVFRSATPSGE